MRLLLRNISFNKSDIQISLNKMLLHIRVQLSKLLSQLIMNHYLHLLRNDYVTILSSRCKMTHSYDDAGE